MSSFFDPFDLFDPFDSLASYSTPTRSLIKKYDDQVCRYLGFLKDTPLFQRYMRQSKFRGLFLGYHFHVIIQNCIGTDFRAAEQIMARCGDFDYERELTRNKWVIPITGSLYNDIRTNFVAKAAQQMKPDDAQQLLESCFEIIKKQYEDSINSNFTKRVFLPHIPEPLEEEGELFLTTFVDTEQFPRQAASGYDPSAEFFKIGLHKHNSWQQAFSSSQFHINSPGPLFTYQPVNRTVDTRMTHPSQAFQGLALPTFYTCDFLAVINDLIHTMDTDIPDMDAEQSMLISYMLLLSSLYDRERLDYLQERQRLENRQKAAKEEQRQKKIVSDLQTECNHLKESVKSIKAANDTIAEKNRKIQSLEARLRRVEGDLATAKKETAKAQDRLRIAHQSMEDMVREVEALQKLLSSQETSDNDVQDTLDTSVFDDLKVVSVGGHATWLNGMQDLHPNITFFDPNGPPPDDAISNADVLWIQTNAISHKLYSRIVAIARSKNIPVRYYSFAGHRACKQQLVSETKTMLEQLS